MATERFQLIITSKGTRTVQRDIRKIGTAAKKAGTEISGVRKLMEQLRRALVVFAAIAVVSKIVDMADALTNLRNRLQSTLGGFGAARSAQIALIKIANETRSSLDTTADAFARFALGARDLGFSTARLLGVTKTLNQAIILSGATAQEARNAMIQLAQGIASGTLRGDELRSVLEQLPLVARVIAKELGVTIGALRDLGKQGKITADAVLSALENAADDIDKAFGNTVLTVGQSIALLATSFTIFLDRVNDGVGVFSGLASAIVGFGESIQTLADNLDLLSGALVALATLGVVKFFTGAGGALKVWAARVIIASVAVGALRAIIIGLGLAFSGFVAILGGPVAAALALVAGAIAFLAVKARETNAALLDLTNSNKEFRESLESGQILDKGLTGIFNQADEMTKKFEEAKIAILGAKVSILGFEFKNVKLTSATIGQAFRNIFGLPDNKEFRELKEGLRELQKLFKLNQEQLSKFEFTDDTVIGKLTKSGQRVLDGLRSSLELAALDPDDRALVEALQKAGVSDSQLKEKFGSVKDALDPFRTEKLKLGKPEDIQKTRTALEGIVDLVESARDATGERVRLEKEAATLLKKQVTGARKLINDELGVEIVLREKLMGFLPGFVALGKTEAEGLRIINNALRKANEAREEEKRIKADPILREFGSIAENEIRIIQSTTIANKELLTSLFGQVKGRELLNRVIAENIKQYKEEKLSAAQGLIEGISQAERFKKALEEVTEAFIKAQGAGKLGLGLDEVLRRTIRVLAGVGNAAEDYADKLEFLSKASTKAALSQEELAVATRTARLEFLNTQRTFEAGVERSFLKLTDEATNTAQQVEDVMTAVFRGAEDALVDFVRGGEGALRKLTQSLSEFFLRLAAKQVFAAFSKQIQGLLGIKTADTPEAKIKKALTTGAIEVKDKIETGADTLKQKIVEGFQEACVCLERATAGFEAAIANGDLSDILNETRQGLPPVPGVTVSDFLGDGTGPSSSRDDLDDLADQFEATPDEFREAGGQFTGEFKSVFDSEGGSFLSGLNGVFSSALSQLLSGNIGGAAQTLVGGLLKEGLGFLATSLLGFSHGGEFTVGPGTSAATLPGVDNRLIPIRAKDGETVTVTPRGQSRGGQTVVFNITTPDINGFNRSRTQIVNRMTAAQTRMSGRR